MSPEYVRDWTDNLAFCTHCKAVFQTMHDAAVHESEVHGRVVAPLFGPVGKLEAK